MSHATEIAHRLGQLGISHDDAMALRRISMTLHRWFELECGDSNDHASWCITRGRKVKTENKLGEYIKQFEHDEDGLPHMETHYHRRLDPTPFYTRLPDRENGARKRLARIMANYPALGAYIQTDPRGCALYILPPGIDSDNYNRGVAVYK